jgi:L-ascorbate metabolism protein UlaG (beta-lactamase superfamily)
MSNRTIRITHYGHACVLAELAGRTRVLFDPGTYSAGFEELTGLDAVLITHIRRPPSKASAWHEENDDHYPIP